MTEDIGAPDLRALLETATDRVESPRLEQVALRTARRRRVRRRGALVAGVASVAVVAVVGAAELGGGTSSVAPPVAPTTDATPAPRPTTQEPWDPREVDDLPDASAGVAPLVPDEIEVPASAPVLADEPGGPAVAVATAAELGSALLLLSDGTWRSVPLTDPFDEASLSPSGERLVLHHDFGGAVVHELATGRSQALSYPDGYRRFDGTTWTFTDDETLLVQAGSRAWTVDARSGRSSLFRTDLAGAVQSDPDGGVLALTDPSTPGAVVDYRGEEPASVSTQDMGRPTSIVVGRETVAATVVGETDPLSVVVADRRTLAPSVVLPVVDPRAHLANGGLSVLAMADDGTVLLRVLAVGGNQVDVVAWDPGSRALSRVTTSATGVEFARDALIEGALAGGPGAPAADVEDVQAVLRADAALTQEQSLPLPADLGIPLPTEGRAGGVVLALQSPGGRVRLVRAGGSSEESDLPAGTLFRHSLADDGGAIALHTPDGFVVHSIFGDDDRRYTAPGTADSGLWLGDSVGFLYDVPGPGGESREHEPPFSTDAMGMPAGDDPNQMDLFPGVGGGVDEVVGGTYVRWSSYSTELRRVDLGGLGQLRGPASSAERWAAVRSGASTGPDGVLVLDHDGRPLVLLPVVGVDIDDVVVHHWVDASRLLLQVADRLLLWHVDREVVTQVSKLPPGAVLSIGNGDGSLSVR
jgi:hypothetical protein